MVIDKDLIEAASEIGFDLGPNYQVTATERNAISVTGVDYQVTLDDAKKIIDLVAHYLTQHNDYEIDIVFRNSSQNRVLVALKLIK